MSTQRKLRLVQLICPPGGPGELLSSPAIKNIPLFRNLPYGQRIPPRLIRGVSRSSRNARRVAVDAGRADRRAARSRTVKSCGPGAPNAGAQVRDDAYQALRGRRWQKSIGSPRRARSSRQTTAQGMFWRKNVNKINTKGGLCPPLCRDPLRPFFFNDLSVEAR